MGGHALQEGKCVADPVGGRSGEGRRGQEGINIDDLGEQDRHDPKRMPQDECEIVILFAPFAQLQ